MSLIDTRGMTEVKYPSDKQYHLIYAVRGATEDASVRGVIDLTVWLLPANMSFDRPVPEVYALSFRDHDGDFTELILPAGVSGFSVCELVESASLVRDKLSDRRKDAAETRRQHTDARKRNAEREAREAGLGDVPVNEA